MQPDNKPEWMKDELVSHIAKEKLTFLEEVFSGLKGKNQKEILSYMVPLMAKAKKKDLTLTAEEMQAAIQAIKKHSTEQELNTIRSVLNKSE